MTPTALPPARMAWDPEQAERDLADTGLYVLLGALPDAVLAATRRRLFEVAAEEDAAGSAYRYDGPAEASDPSNPSNPSNQRVWALLNKGREFVDLALDARALEIMRSLIGPAPLLSNISANITGPGGGPMAPHCDQQFVMAPVWDVALAGNAAWALTDFHAANGATRVVPGSHLARRPPTPDDMRAAVPIEAPAGAMIAFEGRLWHQTGANTTADERRAGVFAYYTAPWLRQQENWGASLEPRVLEASPPELRTLAGLDPWLGLGFIGGPPEDMPRF